MTKTIERVGDTMIATVVTEESAIVDWDDIVGRGESDDWSHGAPWEDCDGWEHEIERLGWRDHEGRTDSRGYVAYGYHKGSVITIDDDDIVNRWGCTGPSGCSKQVRAEAIAAAKRKALDQLVTWYNDGWYVSIAIAEYGDYQDCVGGIWDEPWGDYTEKCIEECRHNVADQLEDDGYTVEGRPEVTNHYNPVDRFRERIRYNLNCDLFAS